MEEIKLKRGAIIQCTPLYDTETHRVVVVEKVTGGIRRGEWKKTEKIFIPLDEIIQPEAAIENEVQLKSAA